MPITAQYTSTASAFRLTDTPATGSALPTTDPSVLGVRPIAVYLQAEAEDIRFTADGSAPTASYGTLLPAGANPFYYTGGPLNLLRFIRAASGAILNVTYVQPFAVPQGSQGAQGGAGAQGAQGASGGGGGGAGIEISVVDIPKSDILALHTTRYPVIPALGENIIPWVICPPFAHYVGGVVGYSGGGALDLFYGGFYEPNIFADGGSGYLENQMTPPIQAAQMGLATFGPLSAFAGPNFLGLPIFSANQPVYIKTHGNTPFADVTDGVVSVAQNAAGSGYIVNDFLTIDGGNGDADIIVTAVNGGGAITAYRLFDGGSGGYSTASNVATSNGSGTGATFDITAGASNALMRVYTLYVPVDLFPT